jgi:hypothetical protein
LGVPLGGIVIAAGQQKTRLRRVLSNPSPSRKKIIARGLPGQTDEVLIPALLRCGERRKHRQKGTGARPGMTGNGRPLRREFDRCLRQPVPLPVANPEPASVKPEHPFSAR